MLLLEKSIIERVRKNIDSIARIESHYLRALTTNRFIEGGKTIAELHRSYTEKCNTDGLHAAKLSMFVRIFNTEYNLSFFTQKRINTSYVLYSETLKKKMKMH